MAITFALLTFSLAIHLAQAAPIRYRVLPVSLDDGYEITEGFIETDGTIGPLSAHNILDYEVHVTGDKPLVLSPTNPGAHISVWGNVYASTNRIIVPPDPTSSAIDTQFFSLDAVIQNIYYSLEWKNHHEILNYSPSYSSTYDHSLISYSVVDPRIISGIYSTVNLRLPQQSFSIAVIPEPSALALGLIGILAPSLLRPHQQKGGRVNIWYVEQSLAHPCFIRANPWPKNSGRSR